MCAESQLPLGLVIKPYGDLPSVSFLNSWRSVEQALLQYFDNFICWFFLIIYFCLLHRVRKFLRCHSRMIRLYAVKIVVHISIHLSNGLTKGIDGCVHSVVISIRQRIIIIPQSMRRAIEQTMMRERSSAWAPSTLSPIMSTWTDLRCLPPSCLPLMYQSQPLTAAISHWPAPHWKAW